MLDAGRVKKVKDPAAAAAAAAERPTSHAFQQALDARMRRQSTLSGGRGYRKGM